LLAALEVNYFGSELAAAAAADEIDRMRMDGDIADTRVPMGVGRTHTLKRRSSDFRDFSS
jgi:hypothetical protein